MNREEDHSARGLAAFALAALAAVAALPPRAAASTIAQNVAWTIDRPESDVKFRVAAYGDSIFAGYRGSISSVAIWSAPSVDGDYASARWGTDVEVIRRCKSGAKARDVYDNKIVGDVKYMQAPETRVVTYEMCGNDALQARSHFRGEGGTCDYTGLEKALADCTTYQQLAMVYINDNAAPGVEAKVVSNLYYPGYDADDVEAGCTDGQSGLHPNLQDVFLGYLARMNWRTCRFASEYGFACADSFAAFMGADYDSNGDGRKDSVALRYRDDESEAAYVSRLTIGLRDTIRDANAHFATAMTSFDYIQSDDTHPTFVKGTIDLGVLGGSAGGSGPPRYPLRRYANGKVRGWRRYGHERMGQALSVFLPGTP